MTAQRYSRILESAKYFSAIDNYIKYITDSTKRGSRVGKGKKRPASQELYIIPFGRTLVSNESDPTKNQVVLVRGAKPTWDRVKNQPEVSARVKAIAPADAGLIVKLSEYRAPRVNIITGRSANGVEKTSAVTGMKYLSYGGTSTSFPFGRKPRASGQQLETQETAFNEIKLDLETGAGFDGALFTWIKEKA